MEIFYSTNKKFLKKIKQNIINYFDKRRKVVLEYELDNKVLISSNILIKKIKRMDLFNQKNKVKSKRVLFNICGVIIKILKAGIYDMMIAEDYKEYNLNKNNICRLSSELFKVVSVSFLEKILVKLISN